MSLPWDTYKPEEEPELPYTPPPTPEPVPPPEDTYEPPVNLPEKRPTDFDFGKILSEAFREALQEAGPRLKESAKDYAKDTIGAIRRGETVDILKPTVVAETSQGHELIVADAKSRSWRTLVQGLCVDIVFAILAAVALITDLDPLVKETWIFLGVMVLKSVLAAIVSYFMRLKVTPTIRTPGERMAVMPVPRPMVDEEKYEEWKEQSA